MQSGRLLSGSSLWDWRRWSVSFTKNHFVEFMSVYSECLRWRANQLTQDYSRRGNVGDHPHVLGTCPRRFNSCHPHELACMESCGSGPIALGQQGFPVGN